VARRLKRAEFAAGSVTLKLKDRPDPDQPVGGAVAGLAQERLGRAEQPLGDLRRGEAEDLRGFSELRPILWQLCEKVARRLKRAEFAAGSVR
jgi:hypothetical protein